MIYDYFSTRMGNGYLLSAMAVASGLAGPVLAGQDLRSFLELCM